MLTELLLSAARLWFVSSLTTSQVAGPADGPTNGPTNAAPAGAAGPAMATQNAPATENSDRQPASQRETWPPRARAVAGAAGAVGAAAAAGAAGMAGLDTVASRFGIHTALALRVVALGWACASWAKATLLLERPNGLFGRRRSPRPWLLAGSSQTDTDARNMGCFYLLVSYLLLNIMQNKELRVAVKPERIRLRRLLWPIVWQTLAAALIDEVATLVITHAFGVPAVLGVHGKPVQANEAGCKASDLASAECMICLSPATAESPLEAFCEHSGHLAHPSCMAKWYSAKGPQQTCPMCRQKLVITVWDSASVMRREGVLRGIAIVLQTSLRWEYAMYRFSLTALSVFSMLSILATRLSFARSLLRQISQESAGAAAAAIAASAVAPALSSDATPPSAAALGDLQSSVLDTVASLNANTDVIA